MTGTQNKPRVFITGESPLVEEYASLCHNKGFAVSVRLNPEFHNSKPPRGLSGTSKPTRGTGIALELTNTSAERKQSNLRDLEKMLPVSAVILTSSVAFSVGEQATWTPRGDRLVGIGAFPSLLQYDLIEIAGSFATGKPANDAAQAFVSGLGKKIALVRDSVGMVLPRILAMLANEACFALGENVATGADIDTAMKLGTNYPLGPLEWAEKIGARQIHAVVSALYRNFNEDRYRPSPFLMQAARQNSFAKGW